MQSPESPAEVVRIKWEGVCNYFKIDKTTQDEIWEDIVKFYSEKHRHYHTFAHIADLFLRKSQDPFEFIINDHQTMDFAIIFHDVIYQTTSMSNEEDSAAFFDSKLRGFVPQEVLTKVMSYIIHTKAHQVGSSDDEDLKLFIDLDLAILSDNQVAYGKYAAKIRQEYIDIPFEIYCQKRAEFLRRMETKPIFASSNFRALEFQAKENILWECIQLESGVIPRSDYCELF